MTEREYREWVLRTRMNYPLDLKVELAKRRIQSFVERYGENGVYIGFSGGKDSLVVLDIARKMYPGLKAAYNDTWLEYPQVREFVYGFDNVDIVKPTMSMKDIVKQYGWCFPSKDVAEAIWYARRGSQWAINKLHGLDKKGKPSAFRQQYKKWLPLYEAREIKISPFCCIEQKEKPIALYESRTGRHPILGLMAVESMRRREAYIRTGCVSFSENRPMAKPISFFRETDNLQYCLENSLSLAPPYGQIVEAGMVSGQYSLFKNCPCGKLCTTGEPRTGCMFCPVGMHLDRGAKIKRLKKYNVRLYDYCMEELGEKKLVEWVLSHY